MQTADANIEERERERGKKEGEDHGRLRFEREI
jgi:hypothetical protein